MKKKEIANSVQITNRLLHEFPYSPAEVDFSTDHMKIKKAALHDFVKILFTFYLQTILQLNFLWKTDPFANT